MVEPEVLRLSGDLDRWQAPILREVFGFAASGCRVVVDLRDVVSIEPAGLGVLIGGIRRIREGGGEVVICNPSRSVADLLRENGIDRLAGVYATVEEVASATEGSLTSRA